MTTMLFRGVTLSLAGLVVLAVGIMRFEFGDVLVGRRRWCVITFVAAMVVLAVAHFRPADFVGGVKTIATEMQREVTTGLQRVGIGVTPTTRPSSTKSP